MSSRRCVVRGWAGSPTVGKVPLHQQVHVVSLPERKAPAASKLTVGIAAAQPQPPALGLVLEFGVEQRRDALQRRSRRRWPTRAERSWPGTSATPTSGMRRQREDPDRGARDVRGAAQVGWAMDAGADFIIGETFEWVGEAMAALETIKAADKHAVITFSIVPHGTLFDADAVDGCRRARRRRRGRGGLQLLLRLPGTMLPLVERVREKVSCHVAALNRPCRIGPPRSIRASSPSGQAGPRRLAGRQPVSHCARFVHLRSPRNGELRPQGLRHGRTLHAGVCCGGGSASHSLDCRDTRANASRQPVLARHVEARFSLGTDPIVPEAHRRYAD